jgi:DNA-directed RNA polymerase specialized sigma24 family protein
MSPTISTELLMALAQATPEQHAEIARILRCDASTPEPVTEDVARNAFALLQRLEVEAGTKAPTVLTVFRLYCVGGLSADQVAIKCRCSKGTVMNRLRAIEKRTGMKAEKFRAMASQFAQMEKEFSASGAKEIYRRGLAQEGSDEEES